MRRYSLLILAAAAPAMAQELAIPPVRYPGLAPSAADAAGFVPAGWRVEREARGDLNGDGAADLAFVLRMSDPANVLANDNLGENPFDTNPRILGVAFAAAGGGYRLAVQDHALIPRREYPNLSDPFGADDADFEIARGTLRLSLYRFANAGGWDMGPTAFTFRWQQDALRLIGFDFTNVKRNTGCITALSINYLTRRARLSVGRIDSETDERVNWRNLPARPLAAIGAAGDGLAFDPEGLVSGFPLDCAEPQDD